MSEIKIKPKSKFLTEEDIALIQKILVKTEVEISTKESLRLFMTISRVNELAKMWG